MRGTSSREGLLIASTCEIFFCSLMASILAPEAVGELVIRANASPASFQESVVQRLRNDDSLHTVRWFTRSQDPVMRLGVRHLQRLFEAMCEADLRSNIRRLDLRHNIWITDSDEVRAAFRYLYWHNATLMTLDVSDTEFCDCGLQLLADAYEDPAALLPRSLRELQLNHVSNFRDDSLIPLIRILKQPAARCRVRILSLGDNVFSQQASALLLDVIGSTCHSLRSLTCNCFSVSQSAELQRQMMAAVAASRLDSVVCACIGSVSCRHPHDLDKILLVNRQKNDPVAQFFEFVMCLRLQKDVTSSPMFDPKAFFTIRSFLSC